MAWLPNFLTLFRILFTPVLVILILQGNCALALPLTLATGLTDTADGYLARRFGWDSPSGAILDPLADKFMLVSLYVTLGMVGVVPEWLVGLVIGRDVLILSLAAAAVFLRGIREFPPTVWGKLSTVVQITGTLLLIASCAGILGGSLAVTVIIWAVAAATAWSGAHYLVRALTIMRATRKV